mmetsp:Transcript_38682/g.86044  ORF Transcript_38682/g.86044 Transcript_38682/m.86044 type:complete len:233 (-) Transcript_38682:70-768(-)
MLMQLNSNTQLQCAWCPVPPSSPCSRHAAAVCVMLPAACNLNRYALTSSPPSSSSSSILGARKYFMYPMSAIWNSTTTGTSLLSDTLTLLDSGAAFAKLFRYRSANVSATGSDKLMTVWSSCLSAVVLCLRVMLAVPTSPVVENLIPSLVADISTVSPILARSRQMRWYSEDGIFASAAYSWSGIVSWSRSMDISLRSKSDIRSCFADSNMRVSVSPLSSAFMVMISSLPAT